MMKRVVVVYICGLVMLVEQAALAQFHQKDKSGASNVNQGAVNAASQPVPSEGGVPIPQTGRITKDVGLNANSTMIMTDAQRAMFRKNKLRMGLQEDLQIDHLARSIQHTDGSYTQTNVEIGSKEIVQITKSKNGVALLTRYISLDERGNPREVMMYRGQGRGELKYRGVLFYDELGRFKEEQLFDAKGASLRRKVQKYGPKGGRLPLKTFENVSNIPSDLQMVVTRESERQDAGQAEDEAEKKKGNGRKSPAAATVVQTQDSPPSGETKKKKGFAFPRFSFGKKKSEEQ